MKNKSLIMIIAIVIFVLNAIAQEKSTFTDPRDSRTYKIVKIGEQTWFAENLCFKLDSGSYSYSNNDNDIEIYGCLYSWYAAKSACPSGWHLPSDEEWQQLMDFLGGAGVAGYKLKETGTTHWNSPNTGSNNISGFTALPGGCRDKDNKFKFIGYRGYWWSSSQPNFFSARYVFITYDGSFLNRDYCNMAKCFSIRCIKD